MIKIRKFGILVKKESDNMKKSKYVGIIFLIFLLDRITKILVSTNININGSVTVIKNFFNLTYVKNTGAAFGMFEGKMLAITLVSIFIFVYLIGELFKKENTDKMINTSFAFIIGGLLGNLYDRIVLKYVIDFFDFTIFGKGFAIFNLGDVFIVVGCFLFFIGAFLEAKREKSNK